MRECKLIDSIVFFVGVVLAVAGIVWVSYYSISLDLTAALPGFAVFAMGVIVLAIASVVLKSCI